MSGDETLQDLHDESDSELEDEEEPILSVNIDPSKLTPLSPEVISKQVSTSGRAMRLVCSFAFSRLPSTWVSTRRVTCRLGV